MRRSKFISLAVKGDKVMIERSWLDTWILDVDLEQVKSQRVGWERIWRTISGGRAGRGGEGRERQNRAVRLEV